MRKTAGIGETGVGHGAYVRMSIPPKLLANGLLGRGGAGVGDAATALFEGTATE
jgi:hypothetical protein